MSRKDQRTSSLRRRPSRAVPAVVSALALLAVGVALVWMAISELTSGAWPDPAARSAGWAAGLTWGANGLLIVAATATLLGVVLLLCAVTPGKPNALRIRTEPLQGADGTTEVVMTRRSVAKLANARAHEVDGVDAASTKVRSRSVGVSVATPSTQRGDLQQTVTHRVRIALEAAGLEPVPTVSATVRTRKL
ncbi:MAG: DUF6286 domain-containing protein [Ornithinimicrobium sp.]